MKNRSSIKNLFVCALLMSVGFTVQANAATLEVGPGKTYATIQSAIDAATGGDTVLIYANRDGSNNPIPYNESVIVANFDSNGDFDYDDPGDKDYTGLRVIGAEDDVMIQPSSTQFQVDGVPYNVMTVYEPRGINDPAYEYRAGMLFLGQRVGTGSVADTYASTAPWPYIAFLTETTAYTQSKNRVPNNGAMISDIEVRNIHFNYADVGLFFLGAYQDVAVRDCEFTNHYYGLRVQGGVEGSLFENNTFTNNLYGVQFRDDSYDNDFVENSIIVNDDFTTENPWGGDGNSGAAVNVYNSNNNQGEYEQSGNQISRNTIDYTAYTGAKPFTGLAINGGEDIIVDNNFVRGTNQVLTSGVAGWITANKGLNVEGLEIEDVYRGVSFGVHTEHAVSRNNFNDFRDFGTNPPAVGNDGTRDYHHLPCDTNFGQQKIVREFTVPATGTTSLSFRTWFSETAYQYVTIRTKGQNDDTTLFRNFTNYSGSSPDNHHFAPPNDPNAPSRHPYGASCSGTYVTPDTTLTSGNRTLDYSGGVVGVSRDGDTLLATADIPVEFVGATVELEFHHYGYYLPAYTCEINGTTDWCGWYVSDVLVSNSISGTVNDVNGTPIDETGGVDQSDWTVVTEESSYAVSFSNSSSAADNGTAGPFNSGFSINQNDFSNPWGDGLVFNSDVSDTEETRVEENNFYDNGANLSGSQVGYALYNDQANAINAENNWWNSNNGPTISTNPGGDGDEIYDPADVVDYDPWTRGLFTGTVDGAAFGAGTTSGGTGYTIEFVDGDRDVVLGTLAADGTFTAGGTTPGGPLLIRVTGSSIPQFEVGDFVTITLGLDTFRAYLPPNGAGQYGTNLLLWVGTDGSTYFACDSSGSRNCGLGDANIQSPTVARNDGDYAQRKGFLTFDFIETPGSDLNWYGQTHFSSDVTKAADLYSVINTQYGGTLVRTLSTWNAASQTFSSYVQIPFPSGNFDLRLGGAYRVEVSDDHTFRLEGAEPQLDSLTYNLFTTQSTHRNWISVPWYRTDLIYASDLAADIDDETGFTNAVAVVNEWDENAQSFVQYINNAILGPVTDFDVSRGQALRVDLDPNVVGFSNSLTYDAIFKMPNN